MSARGESERPVPSEAMTVTYAYNDANELTTMTEDGTSKSFAYDEWGRTTSKWSGSDWTEYAYRYGDKLKSITTNIDDVPDPVIARSESAVPAPQRGRQASDAAISFRGVLRSKRLLRFARNDGCGYDGLGKMRLRVGYPVGDGGEGEGEGEGETYDDEWMWMRYDAGWNMLGMYADDGNESWGIGSRMLTWAYTGMTPQAMIAGADPSSGAAPVGYYAHDHLGSTRALYDASKNVLARVAYSPYGTAQTAGANPFLTFTGKTYDADAGLYHFPYRAYSPTTARWLTRDPLGMVDGPNVYAYVRNSPMSAVDLMGLGEEEGEDEAPGKDDWCVPIWRSTSFTRTSLGPIDFYVSVLYGIIGAIFAGWNKVELFEYKYSRKTNWYCCDIKCGRKVDCHQAATYKNWTERKWDVVERRSSFCIQNGHWAVTCVNPWTGVWEHQGYVEP